MSKILQAITKNTDFEAGKIKLEFYETSFKTLSKIIGDVPGQTIANISATQNVGYQVFRDLNTLQYNVKTKIDTFITRYNTWINTSKSKASTLLNFGYNFTSLTSNYADVIEANDKMDMLLMAKIVYPEQELYDSTIKANESMENNLSVLRAWSKTRPYTRSVNACRSSVSVKTYYSYDWDVTASGGFSVSKPSNSSKSGYITISNVGNVMQNDTIGAARIVTVRMIGQYWRKDDLISETSYFNITIRKNSIGGTPDTGKFGSSISTSGNGNPSLTNPSIISYNSVSNSHFDTNNLNLPFLESRILI